MNIPILLLIILTLFEIIAAIFYHGKLKTGRYNAIPVIIFMSMFWILILWSLGWRI